MFHEYGFGNDGTDATRSCQSHQRDDHMEEQNEDVAHAAWYQTALTSGISAGLVIRHAHVSSWAEARLCDVAIQPRRRSRVAFKTAWPRKSHRHSKHLCSRRRRTPA